MKIDFSSPDWESVLTYAYTRRFNTFARFDREADCIVNRANPAVLFGYDNISVVTREKYPTQICVKTRCSFEKYGAPLIMFANDLYTDEQGNLRFDDYYEVVLWEEGINVWRLWNDGKDPETNGLTWKLVLGARFEVAGREIHELCVRVNGKKMQVSVGGHEMFLTVPELSDSVYVGIDACEGINRFYNLTIEEV